MSRSLQPSCKRRARVPREEVAAGPLACTSGGVKRLEIEAGPMRDEASMKPEQLGLRGHGTRTQSISSQGALARAGCAPFCCRRQAGHGRTRFQRERCVSIWAGIQQCLILAPAAIFIYHISKLATNVYKETDGRLVAVCHHRYFYGA